ncbi:DUF433 domain-containing protein [Halorussus ruber]|uniref:DUF433 domain-containing protein n=1 Tax=Halorussus ruber TaxID=1126238 RepID=UPI001092BDED|nr:DUF433 domain-containing protein [Halorussus ruber]
MSDIISTEDVLSGAPRIEGTRIGVHHVARRVIDGDEEPAVVASDYDLALADVHRALTYYYDHPEEMRQIRSERKGGLPGAKELMPEDVGLYKPDGRKQFEKSEESA